MRQPAQAVGGGLGGVACCGGSCVTTPNGPSGAILKFMGEGSKNGEKRSSVLLFWLPFIFVVLAWILTPIVMTHYVDTIEHRGLAGDLFGSINALLRGLAFAGIIVAIFLQGEELRLQRQELALTREELKRSASAQEKAHSALQATMYAQTFKVALDFLDAPSHSKRDTRSTITNSECGKTP
jgi:hypothetical protein